MPIDDHPIEEHGRSWVGTTGRPPWHWPGKKRPNQCGERLGPFLPPADETTTRAPRHAVGLLATASWTTTTWRHVPCTSRGPRRTEATRRACPIRQRTTRRGHCPIQRRTTRRGHCPIHNETWCMLYTSIELCELCYTSSAHWEKREQSRGKSLENENNHEECLWKTRSITRKVSGKREQSQGKSRQKGNLSQWEAFWKTRSNEVALVKSVVQSIQIGHKKKNRVFFFSSRNLSLGWYAVPQPEMAVLEETTHTQQRGCRCRISGPIESITTGKQRTLVLVSSRDLSRMWYGSCRYTTTRVLCEMTDTQGFRPLDSGLPAKSENRSWRTVQCPILLCVILSCQKIFAGVALDFSGKRARVSRVRHVPNCRPFGTQ